MARSATPVPLHAGAADPEAQCGTFPGSIPVFGILLIVLEWCCCWVVGKWYLKVVFGTLLIVLAIWGRFFYGYSYPYLKMPRMLPLRQL